MAKVFLATTKGLTQTVIYVLLERAVDDDFRKCEIFIHLQQTNRFTVCRLTETRRRSMKIYIVPASNNWEAQHQ